MIKTVAYIRASTIAQDVNNQRHEILEFGHREGIQVDTFIEVTVSSRYSSRQRRIEELQDRLEPGDTLIVTELSRLGRSTGEVILLINRLVAYGVIILIIKQNLRLGEGLQDIYNCQGDGDITGFICGDRTGLYFSQDEGGTGCEESAGCRPWKAQRHDSVKHV